MGTIFRKYSKALRADYDYLFRNSNIEGRDLCTFRLYFGVNGHFCRKIFKPTNEIHGHFSVCMDTS